jgi:hypothetical protein
MKIEEAGAINDELVYYASDVFKLMEQASAPTPPTP